MDYFTALVILNDGEALKDYLLYKMMRKELVEKQCLYNSASFDIKNVPEKIVFTSFGLIKNTFINYIKPCKCLFVLKRRICTLLEVGMCNFVWINLSYVRK